MQSGTAKQNKGKLPRAFMVLLGFIFVFFIGILVFTFVATKRANPVMLDQNGNPMPQSSSQGASR
jgi:hypothetical protein